jgi:hypothetical protein
MHPLNGFRLAMKLTKLILGTAAQSSDIFKDFHKSRIACVSAYFFLPQTSFLYPNWYPHANKTEKGSEGREGVMNEGQPFHTRWLTFFFNFISNPLRFIGRGEQRRKKRK